MSEQGTPRLPRCSVCGGVFVRRRGRVVYCGAGHVLYADSEIGHDHGLDRLTVDEIGDLLDDAATEAGS